jgi:hypothetical protein
MNKEKSYKEKSYSLTALNPISLDLVLTAFNLLPKYLIQIILVNNNIY